MVTLPISSTILKGIVCDGGNWYNSAGMSSDGNIYSAATSTMHLGIAFIVICK